MHHFVKCALTNIDHQYLASMHQSYLSLFVIGLLKANVRDKILLRLDYMPLHYISLNLFEKCLYFQSIFILYNGSSKIWNFDLAIKTEIMIIGLTTSCDII